MLEASASVEVMEAAVVAGRLRAMPPNTREFMSKMIQNLAEHGCASARSLSLPGFLPHVHGFWSLTDDA